MSTPPATPSRPHGRVDARHHGLRCHHIAENRSMLGVFQHSGFHVTSHRDHETMLLRFSICPDDRETSSRADRCPRVDVGSPRC